MEQSEIEEKVLHLIHDNLEPMQALDALANIASFTIFSCTRTAEDSLKALKVHEADVRNTLLALHVQEELKKEEEVL